MKCIGWTGRHNWEMWRRAFGMESYCKETKKWKEADAQERYCRRCNVVQTRLTVDFVK